MKREARVVTVALGSLCIVRCGGSISSTADGVPDGGSTRVGLPYADAGRPGTGSIHSDSGSPSGDARIISSDAGDAIAAGADAGDAIAFGSDGGDAPGPACNPASPFGVPVIVPDLSSTSRDDGLSLSPDGLAAYLSSERLSGVDQIFSATKGAAGDSFDTPTLLAGIAAGIAGEADYAPRISADGLRLYFSSYQNGDTHIYVATRADAGAQFAAPQPVPGVNSPDATADKDEYLTPDETIIYLSSNRAGSQSLYWATASGAGAFGPPAELSELVASPPADDHSPVVTADQLTIFFASDRSGNMDIWMATRATTSSPFGAPVEVTNLNIGAIDYPQWLSSDGCSLYLAAGPSDAMHFYKATRGS